MWISLLKKETKKGALFTAHFAYFHFHKKTFPTLKGANFIPKIR